MIKESEKQKELNRNTIESLAASAEEMATAQREAEFDAKQQALAAKAEKQEAEKAEKEKSLAQRKAEQTAAEENEIYKQAQEAADAQYEQMMQQKE